MSGLKILLNDINNIYQLSYYIIYYKNLEQNDKIGECNNKITNINNLTNSASFIISIVFTNSPIINTNSFILLILYLL